MSAASDRPLRASPRAHQRHIRWERSAPKDIRVSACVHNDEGPSAAAAVRGSSRKTQARLGPVYASREPLSHRRVIAFCRIQGCWIDATMTGKHTRASGELALHRVGNAFEKPVGKGCEKRQRTGSFPVDDRKNLAGSFLRSSSVAYRIRCKVPRGATRQGLEPRALRCSAQNPSPKRSKTKY